jgi:DNA-binding transcriptional ArsR family regulator
MDPSDPVFSALADPTRRQVLRCLSEHPSMTATELAEVLPVSRQAIAKHLGELAEAHLVAATKVGRENRFRLTPAPMADAVSWMASVGARWDRRLSSLGEHLGGSPPATPPPAPPATPPPAPPATPQ